MCLAGVARGIFDNTPCKSSASHARGFGETNSLVFFACAPHQRSGSLVDRRWIAGGSLVDRWWIAGGSQKHRFYLCFSRFGVLEDRWWIAG